MARARKFTALTGGGAGALDAWAGTDLVTGDIAMVMVGGNIYFYEMDASSGATEAAPNVIAPDVDAGAKRWLLRTVPGNSTVPIGTIVAYAPGYFTTSTNGGFVATGTNTVAGVNAAVGGSGWRVCNGEALNLPGSPIYGGSGRYLPNLSDGRFLMGFPTTGLAAGSNYSTHTHTLNEFTFTSQGTILTTAQLPPHSHGVTNWALAAGYVNGGTHFAARTQTAGTTAVAGEGQAHTHPVLFPQTTIGNMNQAENRPLFLACFYIQKVI